MTHSNTNPTVTLVFLAGKRTPFGANGGSLRDVGPTDLCVAAGEKALEQAKVEPSSVDHVIIGNVLQSASDSIYVPRHVGLKLGIPQEVPALGINRLCGSGFQTIVEAYQQMLAGDCKIALVGGVENMSMSPYLSRNARWGTKMGNVSLTDMMVEALHDNYAGLPMGMTAELLGEQYQVTREEADHFAVRSQTRYAAAASQGKFDEEIVPFKLEDKRGNVTFLKQDEHPKAGTTFEKLSKLKSVFKKDGLVTPGTASGIVDGAAMMVVSSEAEAQKRHLQPLARMVSYGIKGCDPKIMGIGPVPAIQQVLKKTGMTLEQMDLIEINEAFASQTLAVMRELSIPEEKLNINGGAIAIGHPLAASGTRIIQTLIYELARQKKRYGLGAACIGGGQGIAIIVESLLF